MPKTKCAFLLLLVPLWAMAGPGAGSILSAVKAASGGARWETAGSLHFRGTEQVGALQGSFEAWVDLQHGCWWNDDRLSGPATGPVREAAGWNGKVSWSGDETGDVLWSESEEARAGAIGKGFLDAFGFLFPKRFAAAIRSGPEQRLEGKRYIVLQARPRGADPVELWIDETTRRIERMRQMTGAAQGVTVYSDFRAMDGLTLPFTWRELGMKPGEVIRRIDVTSVEVGRTPPAGIFDPPPSRPPALEFPAGQDSVTVSFDFTSDFIGLPVSINGMPAETFGFDTGSTGTIATNWARANRLQFDAAGVSLGGGPGEAAESLALVHSIEVGGLRMTGQNVSVGNVPIENWRGMLGYELARSTVVQLDFASRRITFFKPNSFRKPAHAVAVPLRFAANSEPLVEASIDGKRGEFEIDTGQAFALSVNRPFAQRNGLMAKYGAGAKGEVEGVGGRDKAVEFTPAQFTFAGFRPAVDEANILLSLTGSAAEEHVAGSIGNGILKQFTVTLDYQNRVAFFEKNAAFGLPSAPPSDFAAPPALEAGSRGGALGSRSDLPMPDAAALLAKAILIEQAQAAKGWRFTFREDEEKSAVDENGKSVQTSRRTYDNIMLEGGLYRKLILIDGKPPSAKLQKQIDAEMERERIARRAHPAETGKHVVTTGNLDQIAGMCESTVTGQEAVSGRLAWRVESVPKASYQPADKEQEKFLNARRVTWFDSEEGAAVKYLEVFLRPTAGLMPGSEIERVLARHGDAWLLENFVVRSTTAAHGVQRPHAVLHMRFYDYKRFEVESKITTDRVQDR